MTLMTWPGRLLTPRQNRLRLVGRTIQGPPAISGQASAGRTDGGGLWLIEAMSISIRTPDQVRAARAWAAELDGGVTDFLYPLCDLGRAPRPFAGGGLALPGRPAGSDDYFSQDPGFGEPMMVANLAADAALRATSVQVTMTLGGPIRGGEHFALEHPVLGWRIYRFGQVTNVAGTTFTANIRPPLREAAEAGDAVELDAPMCKVHLVPGQADALEPMLELNRFATVDLQMMESI